MTPGDIPTVTIADIPDPIPKDLHILDVREDVEWSHGHIEGAQHIPLMQVMARVAEVPEGQTLVVCRVGGRSAQAAAYLISQGRNVMNLEGGMIDWAASGRRMVSETGADPQVV
jgi:rhodanese-related sulfurtransferase